ncbi:ABC transporter ATP-binding protein [Paenibacillus sp. PAMC21692]|uniref:ABC transporter ATP-binding protein n=1 Tax=Paenibacillus sp. PAMC21692 TaxID=2762320 RepID=UPI00164D737D|nr:ABC transporter ATP-binding protein [Paenibacillus sp. PAMC21692]QNK59734.1 ABC transporter ATP-binding protein [Paenibacillus sp. PAMC21692]
MTYVSLKEIAYAYAGAGSDVLSEFSLTLARGETVGLLGGSGSGKSTLLRLIAGLENPKSGEITIEGIVMAGGGRFVQPEHRCVGMVFQDYALFPHMTVARNIAFGLRGLSRSEQAARTENMLELIQLQGFGGRYPHELSGGQQQRVAFARALAPQPKLLLMDEPFSNLDAALKGEIRLELKELLKKSGMTSILVTHDLADAEAICDRIVNMPEPVLSLV